MSAVYAGSTRLSSLSAHSFQGISVAHLPVNVLNRPHARISHGRTPSTTAVVKSTNWVSVSTSMSVESCSHDKCQYVSVTV